MKITLEKNSPAKPILHVVHRGYFYCRGADNKVYYLDLAGQVCSSSYESLENASQKLKGCIVLYKGDKVELEF